MYCITVYPCSDLNKLMFLFPIFLGKYSHKSLKSWLKNFALHCISEFKLSKDTLCLSKHNFLATRKKTFNDVVRNYLWQFVL